MPNTLICASAQQFAHFILQQSTGVGQPLSGGSVHCRLSDALGAQVDVGADGAVGGGAAGLLAGRRQPLLAQELLCSLHVTGCRSISNLSGYTHDRSTVGADAPKVKMSHINVISSVPIRRMKQLQPWQHLSRPAPSCSPSCPRQTFRAAPSPSSPKPVHRKLCQYKPGHMVLLFLCGCH
jgi:hypothetical protein